MKLRLSTILLSVASLALVGALVVERSQKSKVLYLHLYQCRYDFVAGDGTTGTEWNCFGSLAFASGQPLYFDAYMNYSPQITLEGTASLVNDETVDMQFTLEASDSGMACVWEHSKIEKVEKPVVCTDPHATMHEFMMIVSYNRVAPSMTEFMNPHRP